MLNELRQKRKEVFAQYRSALRWTREIHLCKRTFDAAEAWTQDRDMYEWLKKDSSRAFQEVFSDVKRLRAKLDELTMEIMKHESE